MRIWDVNPGYLNRQSLLGEHRELHGIVSILSNKKKGYSNHPETLRWVDFGWALRKRHELIVAEMAFRGYQDKSPVNLCGNIGIWPSKYIDEPNEQFIILGDKYKKKEPGRIPLPINSQNLWSQHKYSVLARDPVLYSLIGKEVSKNNSKQYFGELALLLTETLRKIPQRGGVLNTLQHMWGHVSEFSDLRGHEIESLGIADLLKEIQKLVLIAKNDYLINSTALSELKVWVDNHGG